MMMASTEENKAPMKCSHHYCEAELKETMLDSHHEQMAHRIIITTLSPSPSLRSLFPRDSLHKAAGFMRVTYS